MLLVLTSLHRWKAYNISNIIKYSNCCTVHELVRSMRFCSMSVCMPSIRSRPDRPGRDQVATWVDDHRRDRDATHWPRFAMLSRHCHDLSLTIATVHDQPETLHNPLVRLVPKLCHRARQAHKISFHYCRLPGCRQGVP
jgi:hypothetical protein